jgi:Uma2 family endonuclease
MQTSHQITVREYLATSYRPDCDFVDGAVVERNAGEKDHSKLQRALVVYFHEWRKQGGINVFPEQRVQVEPTRFRVPDVCVVLGPEPDEQVFTSPPFICIEILSPEDRLAAMQEKVRDYLKMGVRYVWIINPATREAFRCTSEGLQEVGELRTKAPQIAIPVDELFEN